MKTFYYSRLGRMTSLLFFIIIFSFSMLSCGTQKETQSGDQASSATAQNETNTEKETKKESKKAKEEPKYIEHIVKEGETLGIIANKYNVTVEELVKLNNIKNPDLIVVGQKLVVPEKDGS